MAEKVGFVLVILIFFYESKTSMPSGGGTQS